MSGLSVAGHFAGVDGGVDFADGDVDFAGARRRFKAVGEEEARLMRTVRQGHQVAYNAQTAVDEAAHIIVAAELRYGATKKNSPRLTAQLEAVLGALEVLALEAPADIRYGRIRASLERMGRPIGANDLLIAAHALSLDFTLVTDNEREFSRVDGLRIENWLR